MSPDQIEAALKSHGLDPMNYFSALAEQEKRAVMSIAAPLGGEKGDPRRIRDLAIVVRQVLLHRAVELTRSAGLALASENGYALALSVRGHFETTAALGYAHYRLGSLKAGNILATAVDRDLGVLLLGSRDESILSDQESDPFEAKQILNMLEYADKSVSKSVMNAATNEHTMLMDIYKWLSEFCHPNFHSNKLAFALDRDRKTIMFRYGGRLDNSEARILENLMVSTSIFVRLFDEFDELVA